MKLKQIISFEQFDKCIESIKDCFEKDYQLAKLLDADLVDFSSKPALVLQELLKEICKDNYDLINWYIWETDFGKKNLSYKTSKNSKKKYMKSNKDLYNFLCKEFDLIIR